MEKGTIKTIEERIPIDRIQKNASARVLVNIS